MFPFKDVSHFPNLKVFHNESDHGMNLAKLPQTLKQQKLTVPPASETSAVLPIHWRDMSSLRNLQKFEWQTSKLAELPETFVLPPFVEEFDINKCKELPKGFAGLTSPWDRALMQSKNSKGLPKDFGKLRSLKSLKMNGCESLKAMSELSLTNLGESNKLEERWEEMQKEGQEYPLVVWTSKDEYSTERRVIAFRVISSNLIDNMIFYIDIDDDDDHNNAIQILELLPDGSRAFIDLRTRKYGRFGGERNSIIYIVHAMRMSVLTLLDPVVLDSDSVSECLDNVIVFNEKARISCPDTEFGMMILGPEFYPFTLERLNELLSRESSDTQRKSSFEFLIGERYFLDSSGAEIGVIGVRHKPNRKFCSNPQVRKVVTLREKEGRELCAFQLAIKCELVGASSHDPSARCVQPSTRPSLVWVGLMSHRGINCYPLWSLGDMSVLPLTWCNGHFVKVIEFIRENVGGVGAKRANRGSPPCCI
eukprot:Gb_01393 [translate_table: standard]